MALGPVAAEPISLDTRRIEHFRVVGDGERFGELVFRGGLVLRAPGTRLGGLSGMLLSADGGRMLVATDLGDWLSARLVSDADGRLTGIAEAALFARLDTDGTPPANKGAADAEALALLPGPPERVLVAIEQGARLLAYDAPVGPASVPREMKLPDAVRRAARRRGLEALALAPPASPVAGRILLIHERASEGAADVWLLGAGGARRLRLRQDPHWAVTGADFLPGGDLLVLERRYLPPLDIGMRIRRIGRDALAGTGPLDGAVLIEADFSHEIDNMEGIAVHTDRAGRVFVTLISDDNRSFLQRTLVLRFALRTPRPRAKPVPMR